MELTDLIIESVKKFYAVVREDENGRLRSWEHCYKCFYDARKNKEKDYDYLSLQLAFYLASWGMYRGSSFLLQKDYKVHIPVVKEIMKKEYDCLLGMECSKLRNEDIQSALDSLYKSIEKHYDDVRKSVKEVDVKRNVSSTLITKVLMGTLGCVPAYDRYFIEAIKKYKVAAGTYSTGSLLGLVDFYDNNSDKLEKLRENLDVYNLKYPQMKLLDMGFWQIGFEISGDKEMI